MHFLHLITGFLTLTQPISASSAAEQELKMYPTTPTIDLTPTGNFTTSRNYTYAYIHHPIPGSTSPTAVLLHGFPEDPSAVKFLATYVHRVLKLPVLIPYTLGYAPSSRPADPKAYNSHGMTNDLVELLAAENITSIYSFGRDWGSFLASRLAVWHPTLVKALVAMAFAPPSPYALPNGSAEDAERWIAEYRDMTGVLYPNFDYMLFYNQPDSAAVHEADQRRTFAVYNAWEQSQCQAEIFRQRFAGKWKTLLPAGLEKSEASWIDRFTANGWTGPLNWYKAMIGGHHYAAEEQLHKGKEWTSNVPNLFIVGDKDIACPPVVAGRTLDGWSDWEQKIIRGSGHGLETDLDDEGRALSDAVAEWFHRRGFA